MLTVKISASTWVIDKSGAGFLSIWKSKDDISHFSDMLWLLLGLSFGSPWQTGLFFVTYSWLTCLITFVTLNVDFWSPLMFTCFCDGLQTMVRKPSQKPFFMEFTMLNFRVFSQKTVSGNGWDRIHAAPRDYAFPTYQVLDVTCSMIQVSMLNNA